MICRQGVAVLVAIRLTVRDPLCEWTGVRILVRTRRLTIHRRDRAFLSLLPTSSALGRPAEEGLAGTKTHGQAADAKTWIWEISGCSPPFVTTVPSSWGAVEAVSSYRRAAWEQPEPVHGPWVKSDTSLARQSFQNPINQFPTRQSKMASWTCPPQMRLRTECNWKLWQGCRSVAGDVAMWLIGKLSPHWRVKTMAERSLFF